MGILDKLFGNSGGKKEEDKLVLFVKLLMNLAEADGERSEEEGDYIFDYVSRSSSVITKEKWMDITSKAESLGGKAIEMALKLDQNEKMELVKELIGIAASDGYFHGAEFGWIMVLSTTIGLDAEIVEYEILKNHEIDLDELNKSMKDLSKAVEGTTGKKIDLTVLENSIDSEEDEEDDYKDYYPFEKIMDKMRDLLGIEVFETIGKHAGFIVNDDEDDDDYGAIDKNTPPSIEQLINNLFNNYRAIYVFCKVITKLEKLELSKVIDDMIFNFEAKKIPDWVDEEKGSSMMCIRTLLNISHARTKNKASYKEFEEEEFDKGLVKSSETIFNWFLEGSKGLDKTRRIDYQQDISGFLDTFGYGLFLKEEYKASITIYNKSIELYPSHPNIAEHITNRGKSKLKLDDKKGAKLDFERALEKDKN